MQQDFAEARALDALAWLIGEDDLRGVFLGATGLSDGDLRNNASDPLFLGQTLDFILMDDAWILSCAAAIGLPPEQFAPLRAALPGGDLPHWT